MGTVNVGSVGPKSVVLVALDTYIRKLLPDDATRKEKTITQVIEAINANTTPPALDDLAAIFGVEENKITAADGKAALDPAALKKLAVDAIKAVTDTDVAKRTFIAKSGLKKDIQPPKLTQVNVDPAKGKDVEQEQTFTVPDGYAFDKAKIEANPTGVVSSDTNVIQIVKAELGTDGKLKVKYKNLIGQPEQQKSVSITVPVTGPFSDEPTLTAPVVVPGKKPATANSDAEKGRWAQWAPWGAVVLGLLGLGQAFVANSDADQAPIRNGISWVGGILAALGLTAMVPSVMKVLGADLKAAEEPKAK